MVFAKNSKNQIYNIIDDLFKFYKKIKGSTLRCFSKNDHLCKIEEKNKSEVHPISFWLKFKIEQYT